MLSAINVAIPAIAAGLDADAMMLSWIPTAYLLSSAVLLLPFGRVADMYGRKRVFVAGLVVIMLASVLASTARSVEQLVACRVLQGIGAAMLFATGIALLSSLVPRERRGAAIGMSVSAVYFGLACGPMLGGWATHHMSWRAAFLIHLPLALLITLLAVFGLRGEWRDDRPQRFDLAGAVFYACAVTTFMYGLSILPSAPGAVLLASGAAAFAVFLRHERRTADPLFDVSLFFNNRVFTFSCLASLIIYTATFATSFLLSLYLQYIKALTAQAAGLILVTQPAVMALLSPFTGRLADRHEPRVLASAGLVLTAVGLGMLSALAPATTHYYVVFSLIVVGGGFALFSPPNVHAIVGSVDHRHLGTASGAVSTMRVLGQMNSMALVTVIFALVLGPVQIAPENYPALIRSVGLSFLVAACLSIVAIYFSLTRGEMHGRKE
ncbi:MAG: MFS transporter [Gammaproteobacteria bacterium]|nr:MFS transporter [Gammaproteobacteria bacterium]